MLHKTEPPDIYFATLHSYNFSHILLLSRRTASHFRTAIRFNDCLKSAISVTPMPNSVCWNHQHSCSHAMVSPTKRKPQLPDTLSDSLRAGRAGDRIPVWARFSAPLQTDPGAHPASNAMVTWSFSRGLSDRSVALTIPYLAPRLKKECAYTSAPSLGLRGLL